MIRIGFEVAEELLFFFVQMFTIFNIYYTRGK